MNNIFNLESSKVFIFFEKISTFARESYKEKQISNYLVEFAKERNLEFYQDNMFNVIIRKPASKGYESSPIVAIQSHIDMVCEKNKNVEHNFSKDPIKVIYEDDFIKANGTTLGADNGIGVAMALAILDSCEIEHPCIEAIFTTCEEVGMDGATFLDENQIKSKILLNIDSEREGIFTAGCSGGMKATCDIPIKYEKISKELIFYSIFVTGLKGGHSGIDVLKERANSNIILARTLNSIYKNVEFNICSISGGAKDNAIPREAEAIICFEKDKINTINKIIKDSLETYKDEFKKSDPNISVKFEEVDKQNKCFDKKTCENIIYAILTLPNGVQNMNIELVNMPETSNNVGVVKLKEDKVSIVCAVRSSSYSKRHLVFDKIDIVSKFALGSASFKSEYPGWEYNSNSFIRNLCCKVYKDMFGEEAKIDVIHAGLECGIFVQKIKDIDAISFGPNLYNIHTPMEKASISSIDRTWKFLLQVLKEIR